MFEKRYKIPTAEEILEELPMPLEMKKIKAERDEEIKSVLSGKSDKFLIVVGPCSAHDSSAMIFYANLLARLQETVAEKLVIVPRVYVNKSRTKGVGYQGMFLQPYPYGEANVACGIRKSRELLLNVFKESGLTGADEMLYPENAEYVADVLSYYAVGARSVENQHHRQVASGMDIPVGMKNPMGGSLIAMLNSVFAAQSPQEFKYGDYQVRTEGNPFAHAILRGAVNGEGRDVPNYELDSLRKIVKLYEESKLKNPAIIIDTNHSNSGKQCRRQIDIVEDVMKNRRENGELKKIIKGFMIESFLEEGNQTRNEVFGKSITDPCLGWADTERLLLNIAEQV
jgi:3-deoxy-7-phosphoheptulonate synthase